MSEVGNPVIGDGTLASRPKTSRRLIWLLALGLLSITAAAVLRQRWLQANQHHTVPLDPQAKILVEKAKTLEAQVAKSPQDIPQRWALADTYQKLGLLVLAREQLEFIVKADPSSEPGQLALANVQLALGRLPDAEQGYRSIVKKFPKAADAWASLAVTLYHQEKYFEAVQAARKAVQLHIRDANSHYILAASNIELAMQYPGAQPHSRQLNEARSDLKIILSVWPDKGDIYYRLGKASFGLKDLKGAIKYLRRAKELAPERADIDILLARTLRLAGNLNEASQIIEASLPHHPDNAELYEARGVLLQSSTAPDAAQKRIAAFEKTTALKPQNAAYHQQLGAAYLQAGKMDEAQGEFQKVIQLDPSRAVPYQQLATIYTRKGDTKRAALCAKIANEAAFNDRQLANIQATSEAHPNSIPLHLILADRYRDLRRFDLAATEYNMVLQLDPHNSRAHSSLAALQNAVQKSKNRGS
ncbi:MAG: tetratricopeptide repeat protein [Abitibacteriaceae bacterium]|nr:tetratricopeptide repeat protein [Abditibacteriaceae bacterium]